MKETLHNGYVSSGIGLLNIHTLPEDNQSIEQNEMNISVDNGYGNGHCCYRNSSTAFVIGNPNYIYHLYIKKRINFYQQIFEGK